MTVKDVTVLPQGLPEVSWHEVWLFWMEHYRKIYILYSFQTCTLSFSLTRVDRLGWNILVIWHIFVKQIPVCRKHNWLVWNSSRLFTVWKSNLENGFQNSLHLEGGILVTIKGLYSENSFSLPKHRERGGNLFASLPIHHSLLSRIINVTPFLSLRSSCIVTVFVPDGVKWQEKSCKSNLRKLLKSQQAHFPCRNLSGEKMLSPCPSCRWPGRFSPVSISLVKPVLSIPRKHVFIFP